MPLLSVQTYVKNLIDGLIINDGIPALTAYITPPTVEDLDGPRAYVWGARQKVHRQSMPRTAPNNASTAGFKFFDYTVDIYLVYLTNPDVASNDTDFPLIIDTVLSQLWNTTMPVFIDASGNVVPSGGVGISQILNIGEEWDLDYPPEKTPATLRMLYYTCRIGMMVQEAVKG